MARTEQSSKWYVPLVSGTETTERSGNLTTYDVGTLAANIPAQPPWMLPGITLWLDADALGTLRLMPPLPGLYRWEDRSGNTRNATQSDTNLLPTISTTILPRAVNFGT